jgi:PAS domain S-box-containing protein
VTIGRDLTGLQRAEERARKALEELDRFFNISLDLLCMASTSGHFTRLNPAWRHILGYSVEELLQRSYYDFIHPDDIEATREEVAALANGRETLNFVNRYRHRDGSYRSFEWNAVCFGDKIYASARDITDRLRASAAIVKSTAELSAANAELDAFAYAVSHDLRAPLRAMSGFSNALMEDFGDRLSGEALSYLNQITLASRHMSELIDGILALSRSTRGAIKTRPLDISAMAQALLDSQRAMWPERRVAYSVEAGMKACGDPLMIEVALRNLIENAWKYTGKTEEPSIQVHAEEAEGRRWICVADNGAGFDSAHAGKLFKPFQRLHRQEEFPGIGVGLATVQRIVQRHGGSIKAEGATHHGAKFCIALPNIETSWMDTP